jgi:hypothetical protein
VLAAYSEGKITSVSRELGLHEEDGQPNAPPDCNRGMRCFTRKLFIAIEVRPVYAAEPRDPDD